MTSAYKYPELSVANSQFHSSFPKCVLSLKKVFLWPSETGLCQVYFLYLSDSVGSLFALY